MDAVQVDLMLETVKKPQLPPQPPHLWSVGRIVQVSIAGCAFLFLLGYGFAGQMLLSRSPAHSAASSLADAPDTDDALTLAP